MSLSSLEVVELPLRETVREERVAVAAYFIALHRGFVPGHEEADWMAAEKQVDETSPQRSE